MSDTFGDNVDVVKVERIPITVSPYHPLWPYVRKFISDPKLEYAEGKTKMTIKFDINGKTYGMDIEYQDETQSSFEVYKIVKMKNGGD
jgi:hypothetical protein